MDFKKVTKAIVGVSAALLMGACDGTIPDTDKSCEGDAQSTCAYGEFCAAGACEPVPQADATCENFDKKGITWTAAEGTGPVIYSIESITPVAAYPCQQDDQVKLSARVKAYNANDTFPTTRQELGNMFYVKTNGDEVVAGTFLMRDAQYKISEDKKNGEFDLTFCAAPGATQIQIGVYFTAGNEVCHTIQK